MSFGLNVFDSNGVMTLGMDDFTLQKLASMTIPSSRRAGDGVRTDYLLMDVPGYDPTTCFVMITPKVYSSGQTGRSSAWGVMPVYKDLGGTRIAIYTYINYRVDHSGGSKWTDVWLENPASCVVEVVRVK